MHVHNILKDTWGKVFGNSNSSVPGGSESVVMNQGQVAQQATIKSNHSNKNTRKRVFITLKEAKNNLGKTPNTNTGCFLDANDEETRKFIKKAQEEIEECIVDGTIDESIELRGRRANSFALRLSLKDDKGIFSADKLFNSKFCKESEPKITAVTLYTTPEQIRGLRVSQNDDKTRLYEIINGSYNITFNWKVEGKDCSITVDVSSDGKVTYIDPSEGLSVEDLEKNKDVRITIGEDQSKKLTLAELVSLDLCIQKKATEVVVPINSKPSTSLTCAGVKRVEEQNESLTPGRF